VIVRDFTPDDLEPMREIYAHHATYGLGTFEEAAPEAEEFAGRAANVTKLGLPWLVGEVDRKVVGYAYAGPFRPRSAYRYAVEDSVYVAPDRVGQGVGRLLLAEVIARCEAMGLRQMLALIGDSGNQASIGLHRSLGFELSGVMRAAGFKHGRWADVVVMQRALGPGDAAAPDGRGWAK
jgi:phosphinothricin acetyltransferase